MARVSVADVREVLETSLTDPQVTTWIDIASIVIDRYAAVCASAGESILFELERLLTAHFITATVDRSKSLLSKSFGDTTDTYMNVAGDGFNATTYGQQMLMLDPCGMLVDLTKPRAYSKLL